MLKIENVEVFGWEAAIRGMRNPKNSWDKSDSTFEDSVPDYAMDTAVTFPRLKIGDNDLKLMKALSGAGNDHGKFMRMINVTLDIVAPLYWWKEFDTYKVGTVADSCSTMHKIHAKEFKLDDFSHEHIRVNGQAGYVFDEIIHVLNTYRIMFLGEKNDSLKKEYWWQMIQLLPTSYNQRRTVQLNYQVLKSIYHARKNHKLDEWHTVCDWIETLPYSELITGERKEQ